MYKARIAIKDRKTRHRAMLLHVKLAVFVHSPPQLVSTAHPAITRYESSTIQERGARINRKGHFSAFCRTTGRESWLDSRSSTAFNPLRPKFAKPLEQRQARRGRKRTRRATSTKYSCRLLMLILLGRAGRLGVGGVAIKLLGVYAKYCSFSLMVYPSFAGMEARPGVERSLCLL
jgi:hypothetical protein